MPALIAPITRPIADRYRRFAARNQTFAAADPALLHAVDFSSVFITSISDAAAHQLKASGIDLCIVGMDTTDASRSVRRTLLDAGIVVDYYRFLYPDRDIDAQIANVVQAIHDFAQSEAELPGYLWLDVEESQGQALSTNQITRAMDLVEAADIGPTGALVKPGLYSARWVWEKWYGATAASPGWTEPASRGWDLWLAQWDGKADLSSAVPFGGWRLPPAGKQYAGDTLTAIGHCDLSVFAARTPTPDPTPPPQPDPRDAEIADLLTRIAAAQKALAG